MIVKKIKLGLGLIFGVGLFACGVTNVNAEETLFNNLYRVYNPNTGEHFYTENVDERNWLNDQGWIFEDYGGWVTPKTGEPVYRLYNPNAGDHFYTKSVAEYDWLQQQGWIQEGHSFFSSDDVTAPVYRSYNKNATAAGAHMFTISKDEHDGLVNAGWINENIQFYAVSGYKQLEAQIEYCKKYQAVDFDAVKFEEFQVAINKAQAVLDNPSSTEQELVDQVSTLIGAIITLHDGDFSGSE